MKTAANFLLAFILSFGLGTGVLVLNQACVQDYQARNSYDQVVAASCRLDFPDGHGSATIGYVRGRLMALTAGHCFQAVGEEAILHGTDSQGQHFRLKARCVEKSKKADLSLAEVIPMGPMPPMEFPDLAPVRSVTIGETTLQASFPLDLSKIVHKGQLVGAENSPWEDPCTAGLQQKLLIEGLGAPGSSGSAVWVLRQGQWRLAGVYVGSYKPFSTAKVCVAFQEIQRFFDEYEP